MLPKYPPAELVSVDGLDRADCRRGAPRTPQIWSLEDCAIADEAKRESESPYCLARTVHQRLLARYGDLDLQTMASLVDEVEDRCYATEKAFVLGCMPSVVAKMEAARRRAENGGA